MIRLALNHKLVTPKLCSWPVKFSYGTKRIIMLKRWIKVSLTFFFIDTIIIGHWPIISNDLNFKIRTISLSLWLNLLRLSHCSQFWAPNWISQFLFVFCKIMWLFITNESKHKRCHLAQNHNISCKQEEKQVVCCEVVSVGLVYETVVIWESGRPIKCAS